MLGICLQTNMVVPGLMCIFNFPICDIKLGLGRKVLIKTLDNSFNEDQVFILS